MAEPKIQVSDQMRSNLGKVYQELYDEALARGAGNKFQRMSERYKDGIWEKSVSRIGLFSRPIEGGTFLDFGCKFGHFTPLLTEFGAAQVVSVDVDDEYLGDGARYIGQKFGSRYVKSEDCYLDIPSDSVDYILVNEVISHINPSLLDIFYSECARVLKVGGELVISDGNNASHFQTRSDLIDWYTLWESGSSKEFGDSNYTKHRYILIRNAFKEKRLPPETIEYYARNTSGLFGDRLIEFVRRGLEDGVFTERPHRPGVPPIHPRYGVAMERWFYPLQVELSLRTYGLRTEQLIGVSNPRLIRSEEERGKTKNFIVRGTKLAEDHHALKQFAREECPEW